MKEQVSAFLSQFILGTISTVTPDSKPESAYVGYRHSASLELLIGTSNVSRKFQNLQQNSHVAIVVASTDAEVQYEGTAEVISQEVYDELIATGQFADLPGIEKYRNDPTQVYLKITPTWLRFIQHGETDRVEEMTEF